MEDNKSSIDNAMLFAQDIMKYKSYGGDISFVEANNVYNTIEKRGFFSIDYPFKTKPHELIKKIKEILETRNLQDLDRLEVMCQNLNLSMFSKEEVSYLLVKANIRINKVTDHYTIEEKARLLMEYLKIRNLISSENSREEAMSIPEIRLMYELENYITTGGVDDEE